MAVGQTGDPGAAVAWVAEMEYKHVRVAAPILRWTMLASIAKGTVPWPELVTAMNVQVQFDQNSKQTSKYKDYDSPLESYSLCISNGIYIKHPVTIVFS